MYALHEALVRERIRELHRRSSGASLAHELSIERRRHRVSRYPWRRHRRQADWTLAR